MKIACWGYYGKQNLGDDLILAELCKNIRQAAPEAEITVFSDTQKPESIFQGWTTGCPRSVKALLRASMTQDILICGPGGLMPQRGTGKLLLWILLALIMKLRGRTLLFLGLGIGQQNFEHGTDRFLLKLLVKLSRVFAVRQEGVNAALRTDMVLETADVAFAVEQEEKLDKTPKSIVLSLAQVFGNAADDQCRAFVDSMTKTVAQLQLSGYTIHMVEFTQGKDMQLYKKILEQLQTSENIVIHPYTGDPYAMIKIFQQAELSICMRFHSLVLSAVTHTPCCVIAYSDKMDDVAKRLQIENYVVHICPISNLYYGKLIPFDEEKFSVALQKLMGNQALLQTQLQDTVHVLQQKAQINWDVLAKEIAAYSNSDD